MPDTRLMSGPWHIPNNVESTTYGPTLLTDNTPAIQNLLLKLRDNGEQSIKDIGYKSPVIFIEPTRQWAQVHFKDKLSTYIMDIQFIRAPEMERTVYFIVRSIRTSRGNSGDSETTLRANRVSNAILHAIQKDT